MNKIKLTQKQLAIISIIIFILSLLPLFIIAFFNHPSYDDFGYATLTASAYREGNSILEAAFEQVLKTYFNWQGTYSAVFLFSLQPAIFGESFYILSTFIMLGMLIGGTSLFIKTLLKDCLNLKSSNIIILICILLFLSIQFVPSPVESFFWFNGSIFYTFFYSLMLFFFSCIIKQLFVNSKKNLFSLILVPILAVIIAGSNYVTSLLSIFLLCCITIYVTILRKKFDIYKRIWLYTVVILFVTGFIINVRAPGNAVRQAYFSESDPIDAILNAIRYAFEYVADWSSNAVLLLTFIFISPLLYYIALKSKFSFRFPALAPIAAMILIAVQFTPTSYAQNLAGPGRLQNIIFFSYVLLFAFCIYYLCGWVSHRLLPTLCDDKNILYTIEKFSKVKISFCVVFVIFSSIWFYYSPWLKTATFVSAIISLKNGEAQAYHEQIEERLSIIADPEKQIITFDQLKYKPYLLYWSDFDNGNVAAYYEKESITLN